MGWPSTCATLRSVETKALLVAGGGEGGEEDGVEGGEGEEEDGVEGGEGEEEDGVEGVEGEAGAEEAVVAEEEVSTQVWGCTRSPPHLPPSLPPSLLTGGQGAGKARASGTIQEFKGSKISFDSDSD